MSTIRAWTVLNTVAFIWLQTAQIHCAAELKQLDKLMVSLWRHLRNDIKCWENNARAGGIGRKTHKEGIRAGRTLVNRAKSTIRVGARQIRSKPGQEGQQNRKITEGKLAATSRTGAKQPVEQGQIGNPGWETMLEQQEPQGTDLHQISDRPEYSLSTACIKGAGSQKRGEESGLEGTWSDMHKCLFIFQQENQ